MPPRPKSKLPPPDWKPTRAMCPVCSVMRKVVEMPSGALKGVLVITVHPRSPAENQCKGSGVRVVKPHELAGDQRN